MTSSRPSCSANQAARALQLADELTRQPQLTWLVTALGQPHFGWTNGELAMLYRLMTAWKNGEIAVTQLPVGTQPHRDAARAENAAALEALQRIGDGDLFRAKVNQTQRHAEGDGTLHWTRRIILGARSPEHPREEIVAVVNGPGDAPLEIGSSNASTTFMHLAGGGNLARWAYGSDNVVLISTTTWIVRYCLASDPTVRWTPNPRNSFVYLPPEADGPA